MQGVRAKLQLIDGRGGCNSQSNNPPDHKRQKRDKQNQARKTCKPQPSTPGKVGKSRAEMRPSIPQRNHKTWRSTENGTRGCATGIKTATCGTAPREGKAAIGTAPIFRYRWGSWWMLKDWEQVSYSWMVIKVWGLGTGILYFILSGEKNYGTS